MNRNEILTRVSTDGLYLQEIEEHFKHDRDIVLCAVKNNGFALEYASNDLKNDLEIAYEALSQNLFAIQFVSETLLNNPDFIVAVYKLWKEEKSMFRTTPPSIYTYMSEKLKNDEDFLLEILHYDENILDLFPYENRFERFFIRKAVSRNAAIIKYTSAELKNDRNIILIAAKENGFFLSLPEFQHFLTDREIALTACCSNSNMLEFIPPEFKEDVSFVRDIVTETTIGSNLFTEIPKNIREDKAVILNGFQKNKDLLFITLFQSEHKNDETFLLDLIEKCEDTKGILKTFLSVIKMKTYNRNLPIAFIENAIARNSTVAKYWEIDHQ